MKSTHLDEELLPPDLTPTQWAAVVEHFALSAQQARVLALVASGFKEQAIATRLNIRLGTVKEYMNRIRLRLGERNRTGLVRLIYTATSSAPTNSTPQVSSDRMTSAKATGK